jgi:hypothetical protein
MPNDKPNPNRMCTPDQVEHLVSQALPHLVSGLGRDRTWVWFAGDKPAETDRQLLKDIGFSFTPRPHALEDGRQAFWFHPCGGRVLRRGKRGSSRQHSSGSDAEPNDAMAALARLADLLPS